MSLGNRYEVVALVEAKMCNPNGDPDMANLPRMDFATNIGIITDVAIKARIRKYVQEAYAGKEGYDILVKNGNVLNTAINDACVAVGKTKKDKDTTKARDYMCSRYWDVRTLGAVLNTGENAGQVNGAAQVAMATSVDPIEPTDITITRCCVTKPEDVSKERTMGDKTYIPYGLYVVKMTVSANLAEKNGVTEEDMRILLEAIMQMYNTDVTASKMGMSVLSPIVVFKHVGTTDPANAEQLARECKLGCAPAYKLFDMLSVVRKEDVEIARNHTDYDIQLHMENLPAGVICGLKKNPYEDIEWLDTKETVDLL